MGPKQLTDFRFANNAIDHQDKSTGVLLDLDDIESFINVSKSNKLDNYLEDINQWLAQLGMDNNKVEWWCFNAATRNPLASRLIYRLLVFHCCIEKISASSHSHKVVLRNVPDCLKPAIAGYFGFQLGLAERAGIAARKLAGTLLGMARITRQLYQAWWECSRFPLKVLGMDASAIFTFVDGCSSDNGDAYFGSLSESLAVRLPGNAVEHIAYVYRPYKKRIASGEVDLSRNYSLLFSYLSFADYAATWLKFMWLAIVPTRPVMPADTDWCKSYSRILADTLRQEVSRGAAENYLIHRAFRRLGRSGVFSRIIYPFENKALEKCLLLALRDFPGITTVGYQHSSLTQRHFALQLFPGEFENIPMPDRIVTVGDVTRNWLVNHAFPAGKVMTGCSLRHSLDYSISEIKPIHEPPRILFALSSSRYELENTVAFMKVLKKLCESWELGIRCHPNFPASILCRDDRLWLETNAALFSGTSLASNLQWADVLGYVSSTVVLEALVVGLPVIRLDIEALNPDPLLDPPAFCHEIRSPEAFKMVVEDIMSLTEADRNGMLHTAQTYVSSYLKPYTGDVVKEFVS